MRQIASSVKYQCVFKILTEIVNAHVDSNEKIQANQL